MKEMVGGLILLGSLILPSFTHVSAASLTEIQMTANGFVPSQVTINKGDSLKFVNTDTNSHWPASDIHPTHLIYPEFDPKKGILPSQNWTFTFGKAGTWQMHDHLYPQFTGTIQVNGQNDPNAAKVETVQNKLANFWDNTQVFFKKLYYKAFSKQLAKDLAKVNFVNLASDDHQMTDWLKILGGKGVMSKLLVDSGGGSAMDCHQPAHLIGRLAYQVYHSDVFSHGSGDCHSGYYHGAMEAFLYDKGTDNLAQKIDQLCAEFGTSFSKFECLHGVGHGVMAYLNYNMPWSLDLCRELTDSFAQSSCYGGVFMENIVTAEGRGAAVGQHSTQWVSNDPYFPCNAVKQDFSIQQECYLIQTSRMLDISNYDFSVVAKDCLGAPEIQRHTCFVSYGRDAAGQVLRDPNNILALCEKVPLDYRHDCIQGGMNVIVEFWGENLQNQASQFCSQVSESDLKSSCFADLKAHLEGVFGSNTQKIQAALTI